MYAVTERGVVGRQIDCYIFWLQRLQNSYCPEWFSSIETGDAHNPTSRSSQSHRPRPIPLHSRPDGNRTGICCGYRYTGGSGRVINNGTDINARCMRSYSLHKLGAERANGRDALKNIVGAELPFPFFPLPSSLLFFLLCYFYIFSQPRLRNLRERLSSLAGSGGARPLNDI